MRTVYPSVYVIDVPGSFNAIVVGTAMATSGANLEENSRLLEDPRLVAVAEKAVKGLRDPGPSDRIFVDDRAPVEQLTHAIALRYILGIGPD